MSDFILRPASAADAPDIIDIWSRSFGDPPEFIAALLQEADLLTRALCAETEGRVKSAIFAFEGLSLGGRSAAYLYALCTDPAARGRGMGRAVISAMVQHCFDRGSEVVFFSPANDDLAAWYERILGTKPMASYADTPQPLTDSDAVCTPLSAAEYLALRQSTIGVTEQLLCAQSVLHRFFGGGFFRVELDGVTALACSEPRENSLLVRELLCPELLRSAVCSALARRFGRSRVFLRSASPNGNDLVYIINPQFCKEAVKSIENTMFFYNLE